MIRFKSNIVLMQFIRKTKLNLKAMTKKTALFLVIICLLAGKLTVAQPWNAEYIVNTSMTTVASENKNRMVDIKNKVYSFNNFTYFDAFSLNIFDDQGNMLYPTVIIDTLTFISAVRTDDDNLMVLTHSPINESYILKMDQTGAVVWVRRFHDLQSNQTNGYNYFKHIIRTGESTENYIIIGLKFNGTIHMSLMKVDHDGLPLPNYKEYALHHFPGTLYNFDYNYITDVVVSNNKESIVITGLAYQSYAAGSTVFVQEISNNLVPSDANLYELEYNHDILHPQAQVYINNHPDGYVLSTEVEGTELSNEHDKHTFPFVTLLSHNYTPVWSYAYYTRYHTQNLSQFDRYQKASKVTVFDENMVFFSQQRAESSIGLSLDNVIVSFNILPDGSQSVARVYDDDGFNRSMVRLFSREGKLFFNDIVEDYKGVSRFIYREYDHYGRTECDIDIESFVVECKNMRSYLKTDSIDSFSVDFLNYKVVPGKASIERKDCEPMAPKILGLEPGKADETLSVFATESTLNINSYTGDYKIISIRGEVIAKGTISNASSVDVSHLNSGIYIFSAGEVLQNVKFYKP